MDELNSIGVAYSDHRAYKKAKKRLERARAQLDEPSSNLASVFAANPASFTNLWRHEHALSRSLYNALHELERLQARRAGEHVAAPEVMDVNINLPDPPPPDIESSDGKDQEEE